MRNIVEFAVLFVSGLLLAACADVAGNVRKRAARDLACADTRVVDEDYGVYRVAGCGFEASYRCSEDVNLSTRCERLYVSKTETPAAPKAPPASNLAKSE